MRIALLLCCIGLLPLLGCSPEMAPVEEPSDTGLEWLSPDGRLHYTTPDGKVVRGHATDDGGVAFSIQDGKDSFGFELAETHLYEWAIENDERHDLRIEYNLGIDRVDYIVNGKRFSKRKSHVPELESAKMGRDGEIFFHEALDLDLKDHRVYENPLGEELIEVLEGLNGEIEDNGRFITEDNACSGPFMTSIGLCLRFKCPWGGVANPVCHACVGTAVACLVLAIAHLAGG